MLDGPTIRAIRTLCATVGKESICAAGPMAPAAVEVIAGTLH
jgi:hypothetical protein